MRRLRWATVPVPCDPEEPNLFSWADVPCFQQVETFLCFACIERRLGRQLTQEDLNTSVWNAGWIDPVDFRERYGAHERLLAPSMEKTAKARAQRLLPHSSVRAKGFSGDKP